MPARIASANVEATANFSGYRSGIGDFSSSQLFGMRFGPTEAASPASSKARANRAPRALRFHIAKTATTASAPA
jgi:hypothetical protein